MKKKVLVSMALGFMVLSCKKDYTCTCDGTAANQGIQTYTIEAKNESDAKETCEGYAENTAGLVVCGLNE